jgi:hypothetical protein
VRKLQASTTGLRLAGALWRDIAELKFESH